MHPSAHAGYACAGGAQTANTTKALIAAPMVASE
jgi:hypothetical protein